MALDELSTARTLPEVESRFGNARRLTEMVLGFPVSGGHATRRAIRAVGGLLCHRLGPAVAAEALTWSASLTGAVRTATIETFLELALEAPGTYRPWRLAGACPARPEVVQSPQHSSFSARTLCDLWTRSRSNLLDPETDYWRDSQPGPVEEWKESDDDLAQWLREITSEKEFDARGIIDLSPEQQRRFVEAATTAEVDRLSRLECLFSMDSSVVGACLLQATRSTLANQACPPELRDRVRRPYDLATLELAVRAGPGCFEPPRVRRMLADMNSDSLQSLLAAVPVQTLETLRNLGLLSVDELLTGRLRHLDLEDRRICSAALGSVVTAETLDVIVGVALRHPQTEKLIWLLDDAPRGAVPPDAARRLIDAGRPLMAKAAMRHLPLDLLVPSDKACAAACGDVWLAACPGLSALERPGLPPDLLSERPRLPLPTATRVWYPERLRQLEMTRFKPAPGWRITLPRTTEDIRHNAKVMRNCTAGLIDDVLEGSMFLVIVHDPDGHRYNVAVTREKGRFAVGHINSWANGGIEPMWIRSAFTHHLNDPEELAPWESQTGPVRHPTPKRDRRRARARAARQRRP